MILARLVMTFAAVVAVGASAVRSEQSPTSSDGRAQAEPAPKSQAEVEAQITKMLEELRRANKGRVTPEAPTAPAPVAPKPGSPAIPRPPRLSTPSVVPVPLNEAALAAPPPSSSTRQPLPPIEGFTSAEVQAFLGAPNTIQQGASGVTVWYYVTPAGRLPVHFVGGLATIRVPVPAKGSSLQAPARREPGVSASCVGIEAVAGPKALVVRLADTPAFIEPRLRQVPLALLRAGAKLEVVSVDGAWYLVRFSDERWGKRVGYVHCTDVQRPE
jgi:hypothetical protein